MDEQVFRQEMRRLKTLIREDPATLSFYDTDGDGDLSGQEWERAVQQLRERLEQTPQAAATEVFEAVRAPVDTSVPSVANCRSVVVRQQVEKREVFLNYETANRYTLIDPDSGSQLGGADEDHGGFGGYALRQILGSARPLHLTVTEPMHSVWMEAHRKWKPLGFIRPPAMVVHSNEGLLGTIQRVWPLVVKRRYVIQVANEVRQLVIDGSLWKPWTFPVLRDEREVACIKKKWSGGLREVFTDADTFRVEFIDGSLGAAERRLLVAAALAIDFDCFESSGND